MIGAKQAIEIASIDGFCKLGQHVFLWKTCEAAAHIKIDGVRAPFLLIRDPHGWEQPIPVASEWNKKLLEVCK